LPTLVLDQNHQTNMVVNEEDTQSSHQLLSVHNASSRLPPKPSNYKKTSRALHNNTVMYYGEDSLHRSSHNLLQMSTQENSSANMNQERGGGGSSDKKTINVSTKSSARYTQHLGKKGSLPAAYDKSAIDKLYSKFNLDSVTQS